MVDIQPVKDHGGALSRAEARFGTPAEGWLDLSTGINPWPYHVPALPADLWNRLPDEAALQALNAAAARYYRVADPSHIAAASGSQALIQALPGLRPPGQVAIVGFTYAEHARCWALHGHEVRVIGGLDEVADADVLVVTNPNNPDGRRINPAILLELAADLAKRDGLLVVDEAFADVTPQLSVAAKVGRPGLCVLRSFGKFFGLAGLRLGFALAPAPLAARLTEILGPWTVSGPALWLGRRALEDTAWIAATRKRLDEAARGLDARLESICGLPVIGGTPLFRLIEHADAKGAFESCARQGVLLRAFDARPGWLRIGLPPDGPAMMRLLNCLSA